VKASFRHRGLKALYEGTTTRRVIPARVQKLRDILASLDRSRGPEGMNLPGFRMAIRLSKAFGSTPEAWLGMQTAYDLWQARSREEGIVVEQFASA